jgi:Holliday junction resolvase RusA-like endonuclease
MATILNHAISTYKGPPLVGPLHVRLQFIYQWPKSWKEDRRRESGAHLKISVPDIDNLSKLALDALQPEVIEDDSTVCRLEAWKQYGLREGTTIFIEQWEWQ